MWCTRVTVLLCTLSGFALREASGQEQGVALVNTTVVDVVRGTLIPGQTILTRNGRIARVGPAASVAIPRGFTRVDARGQFAIPGLWDMHVHVDSIDVKLTAEYFGALFLANGVTGVRDAGGFLPTLRALDSLGRATSGRVPRMLLAGGKVGPRGAKGWSMTDTRAALAARIRDGAHHIKLWQTYPKPLLAETAPVCATLRVRCLMHIPAADTAFWVPYAGAFGFEHLFNLAEHVASLPAADLFKSAAEYRETPTFLRRVQYKLGMRARPREPLSRLVASRDTTRDAAFFQRLAAAGTWITPTLVLHHQLTRAVPILPAAIDSALTYLSMPTSSGNAADGKLNADLWSLFAGLVRAMNRAGVPMLAGTDLSEVHVPGASLQAELVFLQQAGLTAAEVLRMATINPARFLSASDSLGQVAPGHVADLVILRGNPLDDIRHVTEVEMVMTRGHLLRRAALDSMVDGARRAIIRLRPTSPVTRAK